MFFAIFLADCKRGKKTNQSNVYPDGSTKVFQGDLTPDVGASTFSLNGKKVISSANQKYIIVAAMNSIYIIDENLEVVREFVASDEQVNSVCLTADGKHIITGDSSGNLKIFDFSTQNSVTSESFENAIVGVSSSFDGRFIFAIPESGEEIYILNFQPPEIKKLGNYQLGDTVMSIFVLDRYLFTGGMDNRLNIFRLLDMEPFLLYEFSTEEFDDYVVSIAGWGDKIAVMSFDSFARVFSLSGSILMSENFEEKYNDFPYSVAMLDNLLIISGESGHVYLYNDLSLEKSIEVSQYPIEVNMTKDYILTYDDENSILRVYTKDLKLKKEFKL